FVDAGTELATRFVDDPRIALVSFTGSTTVGRTVGERVAARLGKSLLELGGNNAVIVDETANMDLAVPAIVFGAVGTAGQRCTTTRRVFVHNSRL
ncbi:aldehyde dehydrogenase family protein, partial [Klebsiella pneumoniae]|uniref:aldehyde dehydrogenase family protein n=1 Tax=Klebsiella pneumoniae TaxID=573 RepID=UPI003013FB99